MKRKLLIVEDDCLLAEAAGDYFTSKGWEAEIKEDGIQALDVREKLSFNFAGCDDAGNGWFCTVPGNPEIL